MTIEIITIDLGGVNCYLLGTDNGFVLIDSGVSNKRSQLVAEMENTGCRLGSLKLIVLTQGEVDHAANAAYLR